ncbi:MAG: SDR family NAD(P)-dependent oxidoreductase [Polyangiaceae bacterium]
MAKTIVVCGHGPGISEAVARRFGKEGYSVALVARNAQRLAASEKSFLDAKLSAKAFPCDLGDPEAVRQLMAEVSASLGPVAVVHWNAYAGRAGDLKTASTEDLQAVLNVGVVGMIAAVQAALPDLRANKGALLITGGGFAFYDPAVDAAATQYGAAGLALAKAAQHKAAGLLGKALQGDGVYVGEVIVTGSVKGTAFDGGQATLEASTVADKFWSLFQARDAASVTV